MPDKKIELCKLYENISKTSGRRYFVGNLSFTSRLLIFKNDDALDGAPGWTAYISEREVKPHAPHFSGTPGDDAQTRRRPAA